MENLQLQQMSAVQTVLWYLLGVIGSLLIYAYLKVRQKPDENFSLKKFFRQNALRIYLGLGVTAFLSVVMFNPEASTFLELYFPIKVSPASPLMFGASTAAFLIFGIRTNKASAVLPAETTASRKDSREDGE